MRIELVQKLKFFSTSKTKTTSNRAGVWYYEKYLEPHSVEEWVSSILLPPLCPSSNGLCKIIEISYMLIFNFDVEGSATSTDLPISIVIGWK